MVPTSTEPDRTGTDSLPEMSVNRSRARALRHLRILAVAYILLLLVGTHWPRLDLSGPTGGSDKLLHLLGFGLLIIMLRLAGWSRRFWSMCLWGLFATVLVEYTQHWLPIGRYWSIEDIFAGMMGVVIAALIAISLEPVGGSAARDLRARWFRVTYSLLERTNPCMSILVTGALGVMVGGILAILLHGLLLAPLSETGAPFGLRSLDLFALGGLGVGIPATIVCFLAGHRVESTRLGDLEPDALLRMAMRTRLLRCLVVPFLVLLLLLLFPGFLAPVMFLFLLLANLVTDSPNPGLEAVSTRILEFFRETSMITLFLVVLGPFLARSLTCFMREIARIADQEGPS